MRAEIGSSPDSVLMKQKLFIAVAICLALLANNLRAELTQTDAERLCKQLKVSHVKCFDDARAQLKVQPAAEYLKNYLKDSPFQSQVLRELEKLMPEIEDQLKARPNDLALVSVMIDSPRNGNATQSDLISVQWEGMGDASLQALAPGILSGKLGATKESSANGVNIDTNRSHVICLGFDQGQVKATTISLPTLRATVTAAVEDLQKSVALAPKGPPVAPTNFRIQIAPQ